MENKSDSSLRKDEDVFYILVATDCHLGYEENDPIIGDDSFIAFEEILIKAVDNNVSPQGGVLLQVQGLIILFCLRWT